MKVTVKTLEGMQFEIDVEDNDTIESAKFKIEEARPTLEAAFMRLLHAGKVLRDEQTFAEAGVNDRGFIVCMVQKNRSKAPKSARGGQETQTLAPASAPATTPAPVPVPAPVTVPAPAVLAAAAPSGDVAPTQTPIPTQTPTPAQTPIPTQTPTPTPEQYERPEDIARLQEMGFPETEVRSALRAAKGNPDVAVEFLFNGIPNQESLPSRTTVPAAAAPAPSTSGPATLQSFRSHPQFNMIRRLVQSNPAALQEVLQQIGRQNPQLLAAINANQEEFVQMMGEPIQETDTPAARPLNPAQLLQMLQSVPPALRTQMAAQMGLTPEALAAFTQAMASMPPEQFQQMMSTYTAATGRGAGAGGGASMPGPRRTVIRLTEAEGQAINRLVELGFDRNDAVQAFLACDKDEAMAANLLMDGWNAGANGAGLG